MSTTETPIVELVATVRESLNEIVRRSNELAKLTLEAQDERNRLRVRLTLMDRMQDECVRQTALLQRIRQWDILDGTPDGPYWKNEIDIVLDKELEQ